MLYAHTDTTAMKNFSSFKIYPGIFRRFHISDRFFVSVLLCILLVQFFAIVYALNKFFLVEIPLPYGTFTEGSVEKINSKNPLYASSTIEKDLASLLHASLFTYDADGILQPELATSITTLDANTYTVHIHKEAVFHDNTPVTAEDVIFTVAMLRESDELSSYTHLWEHITLTAEDEKTLFISVADAAPYFPEALATPILPSYIWKKIPFAQRVKSDKKNTFVGAGPYKYDFEKVNLDEQTTEITLQRFDDYVLSTPYIQNIRFIIYATTKEIITALQEGEIDAIHSVSPVAVESVLALNNEGLRLNQFGTDRLFGVFYNLADGKILADPLLRSILSQNIDRSAITTGILQGYARNIWKALPRDESEILEILTPDEVARTLDDVGWGFNPATGQREKNGIPLRIVFIYPDVEEVVRVAEFLAEVWEGIGIGVDTEALSPELLERRADTGAFDAIFYGYTAHTVKDLVPLWKSGDLQNIANFTSFGTPQLNDLLTEIASHVPQQSPAEKEVVESDVQNEDLKDARKVVTDAPSDTNPLTMRWQDERYAAIQAAITWGHPAVFLYSPTFLYITNSDLSGVTASHIREPSGRYRDVHLWHLKKEKIWKWLATLLLE